MLHDIRQVLIGLGIEKRAIAKPENITYHESNPARLLPPYLDLERKLEDLR